MKFYHFVIVMMLSSVLTMMWIERYEIFDSQVDMDRPCQDSTVLWVK